LHRSGGQRGGKAWWCVVNVVYGLRCAEKWEPVFRDNIATKMNEPTLQAQLWRSERCAEKWEPVFRHNIATKMNEPTLQAQFWRVDS
jgi:hypothetical protein